MGGHSSRQQAHSPPSRSVEGGPGKQGKGRGKPIPPWTLHERVARARAARAAGKSTVTLPRQAADMPDFSLVVCPHAAKQMVEQYDHPKLPRTEIDSSESDSASDSESGRDDDDAQSGAAAAAGDGGCPSAAGLAGGQPVPKLVKPSKRFPLLETALTNSNGPEWRRQRPLVAQALAGPNAKRSRAVAAKVAADRAMAAVQQAIASGQPIDARALGLDVASAAVSTAVAGARGGAIVAPVMVNLYGADLGPRHRSPDDIAALTRATHRLAIERRNKTSGARAGGDGGIADPSRCTGGVDDDAADRGLLHELVDCSQLEAADSVTCAVHNAHSALLAGVQSVATTLAAVLTFLAATPELQDPGKLDPTAAVRETLRVLPPVANLPRQVQDAALVVGGSARAAGGDGAPGATRTAMAPQSRVNVDLVAAAHGGSDTSLQWDPVGGGGNAHRGGAAPWGMGPRVCPAGTLSVMAVAAAVRVLVESGVRWRIADDALAGLDPTDGSCRWLRSLVYKNTLIFSAPLPLIFERPAGNLDGASGGAPKPDAQAVVAAAHHDASDC